MEERLFWLLLAIIAKNSYFLDIVGACFSKLILVNFLFSVIMVNFVNYEKYFFNTNYCRNLICT